MYGKLLRGFRAVPASADRYASGGFSEPRQLGLEQGIRGSVGQTCLGEIGSPNREAVEDQGESEQTIDRGEQHYG
jgi:hypothetical protein